MRCSGQTLIELLVVLLIAAIAAAIVPFSFGRPAPPKPAGSRERTAALVHGVATSVSTLYGPGVQLPDGRIIADSTDPFGTSQ